MKHNIIRYSLIALLIGLGALAASRAYARENDRYIIIESYSWGFSSGQTARVSVVNFVFLDGSVRSNDPLIARIQLLDTEGEVLAQSDEIRVTPGQTRFWDAPRESLPAREPTGRIQVRTRILVMTMPGFDRNKPPLVPTVELIDSGTGRTVAIFDAFLKIEGVPGEAEG